MILDARSSSILWTVILCIVNVNGFWIEFDFVKVENSNEGLIITNTNVVRKNKTTFAISGTIVLAEDLSDKYDMDAAISHSPLGNNQYILSPFKFPRGPLCDLINNRFRLYVQPEMEQSSNCPKERKNEPLCPLYKKGTYTIRGYNFDKNSVPQIFHTGQYKVEFTVYEKNSDEINSKGGVIFKLY